MSHTIDITTPAAFEHDCAEVDSELGELSSFEPMPEGARVVMTRIGSIERGIDGNDSYVMLTRLDDDMTPDQAHAWLLPQVYHESTQPGGYFCTSVMAVQAQYSTNQVICTVQHRYDV